MRLLDFRIDAANHAFRLGGPGDDAWPIPHECTHTDRVFRMETVLDSRSERALAESGK